MNKRTQVLVEGGMMVALALLLHFAKIMTLGNGGSITAGMMIPLLIYGLRRGAKWGALAGTVFGLLQMLIDGYAFHPLSFLFDYIIAFGILGLAGIFNKSNGKIKMLLGCAAVITLRYASHVISGAIVFASYAPSGQNAWVYSAVYNATYMVPEGIIAMVVIGILLCVKRSPLCVPK